MSQVVTLYKDKEKTDALYPRTKVSAISDDNNTSLQELLNRNEVIDNLTSYETDKALSANQGRELNDNFKNYYNKTEVNNLLDNIDVAGMVKQEEGGTEEEVVTPTNADTLGGKLTANNVVFYEEETVDEVGQVVLRNADLLDNHPASYFATSEELNTAIANSGLQMDLLWTNASPTSTFTPQTISLNLSGYKFIIGVYAYTSYNNEYQVCCIHFTGKSYAYTFRINSANSINIRAITISSTGISIGNCETTATAETDSEGCIPIKVYGIK